MSESPIVFGKPLGTISSGVARYKHCNLNDYTWTEIARDHDEIGAYTLLKGTLEDAKTIYIKRYTSMRGVTTNNLED